MRATKTPIPSAKKPTPYSTKSSARKLAQPLKQGQKLIVSLGLGFRGSLILLKDPCLSLPRTKSSPNLQSSQRSNKYKPPRREKHRKSTYLRKLLGKQMPITNQLTTKTLPKFRPHTKSCWRVHRQKLGLAERIGISVSLFIQTARIRLGRGLMWCWGGWGSKLEDNRKKMNK